MSARPVGQGGTRQHRLTQDMRALCNTRRQRAWERSVCPQVTDHDVIPLRTSLCNLRFLSLFSETVRPYKIRSVQPFCLIQQVFRLIN